MDIKQVISQFEKMEAEFYFLKGKIPMDSLFDKLNQNYKDFSLIIYELHKKYIRDV